MVIHIRSSRNSILPVEHYTLICSFVLWYCKWHITLSFVPLFYPVKTLVKMMCWDTFQPTWYSLFPVEHYTLFCGFIHRYTNNKSHLSTHLQTSCANESIIDIEMGRIERFVCQYFLGGIFLRMQSLFLVNSWERVLTGPQFYILSSYDIWDIQRDISPSCHSLKHVTKHVNIMWYLTYHHHMRGGILTWDSERVSITHSSSKFPNI